MEFHKVILLQKHNHYGVLCIDCREEGCKVANFDSRTKSGFRKTFTDHGEAYDEFAPP